MFRINLCSAKEAYVQEIIQKILLEEAKKIGKAFRDGDLKITGIDVDQILPFVSRFCGGASQDKKKQIALRTN